MKKIIPLLAVLLFTSLLAAQDLIINDTVYNAGFYTSFEEFKYNKPSIPFNYETKSVTNNVRGGTVTYHRIAFKKKEAKALGVIFGFSDGKHVYILDEPREIIPNTKFMQIQKFGKLCYFERGIARVGYNNSQTIYLLPCLLNMESGEIIKVDKTTLPEIIADNKALLEAFEQEKKQYKVVKDYLLKYLEGLE